MQQNSAFPQLTREHPGEWSISGLDWMLLTCITVLAACVRFDFLRATNFGIDSDEAIVGLMAKHILEGKPLPIFYYGQHYMGSLEGILVSCMFRIFGISSWALQSVPYLCSVLLVPVVFLLTRELGGRAAAHFSAVLYALPPAGLLVWSSKARGGFIEILLIGAFALLYTCRWLRQREPNVWGPAVVGFLLGVGWWVNNQILYFMAPIGVCMAMRGVRDVFDPILEKNTAASKFSLLKSYSLAGVVGILTFLFGSSPYWIYNIKEGFPSLGMFGFATFDQVATHFYGLITVALPILLGSRRFWDADSSLGILSLLYLMVYGVLSVFYLVSRRRQVLSLLVFKIDRKSPLEILPLFILVSLGIFVISTFGWLVQAPRYLLPVYIGVFPLCGVLLEILGGWKKSVALAGLLILVCMSTIPAYFPNRALQGEPVVFQGERVEKDHTKLIHRLDALGINKVRTNYWIGYRLAFETLERITFVVFQDPRTVRIPEYETGINTPQKDELPLVVVPSEAILVRSALEKLGYTFKEEQIRGYYLFHSLLRNDSDLEEVPASSIKVSSSGGILPPTNVLDGNLSSRWGTGAHQEPGQFLRLEFTSPMVVEGIQLQTGDWMHDYPRDLSIVGIQVDGTEKEFLAPKDYVALRYFAAENGEVRCMFEPTKVVQVLIRQTGNHSVFDWSVAEVTLFQQKGSASQIGEQK